MADQASNAHAVFLPAQQGGIMDFNGKWKQFGILSGELVRMSLEKPNFSPFLAMEQSPGNLLNRRPELFFASGTPKEMAQLFSDLILAQLAKIRFDIVIRPEAFGLVRTAALKKIEEQLMASTVVSGLLENMLANKPLWWPMSLPSGGLGQLLKESARYPKVLAMVQRLHDLQPALDKVWGGWTRWSTAVKDVTHRDNLEMLFQQTETFHLLASVLNQTRNLKNFDPCDWVDTLDASWLIKSHPQGSMIHLRVAENDTPGSSMKDFLSTARNQLPTIIEAWTEGLAM